MVITAKSYPVGHPPLLGWLRVNGFDPDQIPKDGFSASDETGEWVIRYRLFLRPADGWCFLDPATGEYVCSDWLEKVSPTAPPPVPSIP